MFLTAWLKFLAMSAWLSKKSASSTPIPVLPPLPPPEQAALRLEPLHDVAEPSDETSL